VVLLLVTIIFYDCCFYVSMIIIIIIISGNSADYVTTHSGNARHSESGSENEDEIGVRGIFSRSLYCRYVLPELYKIFHVRDSLVRATLLQHFHRYAAMFDHTTLTRVIMPQVCFIFFLLL